MGAIQPPFDLYLSPLKTRANFFPWHAAAVSLPADGVILRYLPCRAHTQDFLQAIVSTQSSMGIAWVARYHREALFPLRKKAQLQEVICCFGGIDPRQAHLLYQAVLQGFEQSLDPSFRLWTVRRDPFDP